MSRKTGLVLVTALLVLAALLRLWDLAHMPPGFNRDELAHIRITEAMRAGEVSVYYQIGDRLARAALFGALNTAASDLAGGGLLGYRMLPLWSGLITLALLYALGRRLFGVPVALIALAAMSVNLRAVLLARTVTAESLVPLYTLLMLFFLAVAFNLRPVSFAELQSVADPGGCMPPKSTYIEPKLRSGLTVYSLEDM